MATKRKDILVKLIIIGAAFLVLLLTLFGSVENYEIPEQPARPANEIKEK